MAASITMRRLSSTAKFSMSFLSIRCNHSSSSPSQWQRAALGISSFFCIPEQGMEEFEVLSRGSAFAVPTTWYLQQQQQKSLKRDEYDEEEQDEETEALPRFHIITCAHITRPFEFPHYYPMDWLSFVEERHTLNKIQLREEETGRIQFELQLRPCLSDPGLDLAVLHLDSESETQFMNAISANQLPVIALDPWTPPIANSSSSSESLIFVGHDLVPSPESVEDEVLVPSSRLGELFPSQKQQNPFFLPCPLPRVFAQTEDLLQMGSCGGPILSSNAFYVDEYKNIPMPVARGVIGMLEGIVQVRAQTEETGGSSSNLQLGPESEKDRRRRGKESDQALEFRQKMNGAASILSISEIVSFLRLVEAKLFDDFSIAKTLSKL